ncbi:DNA-(apurinic or apyrimidinic site) endonuclease 2 [[Candida] railenensis]|uniref:DNA-(apurinic or apyrimidinic site) endonuclease 2 n=1 Tax=[Candida] railenensis TaxID=45579 RepID=A0A9P0QP79_9ASCO|nr:DNA-(apurinic or apyrimidinic site) endonuclease 2 [[Candida] railenensis]
MNSSDPIGSIFPNKKDPKSLRLVTFNVNGVKTLFNYYPWNKLQSNYDVFFNRINADIISLQELKLSLHTLTSAGGSIGNLKDYQSFITIPKSKRGYSGVGVFVNKKIPVIRAEEGITGWLSSPEEPSKCYRERDPLSCIGGYPPVTPEFSKERCLDLDDEGRCICIELANNIVVISVYCPANSSGTDEGEVFRMDFLQILLQRCFDLKHVHNKEVILMGDINVSQDLIDNAEGIQERIKSKLVKSPPPNAKSPNSGYDFEKTNLAACLEFKTSRASRELLNSYTIPTLATLDTKSGSKQFLHDTTRIFQGRKLGMYTVWNTLTGARQSNYGSRIDLILSSSKEMCDNIIDADICPLVNGSDHCPVYTDFDIQFQTSIFKPHLKFEAKTFYKLVQHRDISSLFGIPKRERDDTSEESLSNSATPPPPPRPLALPKRQKIEYVSRKKGTNPSKSLPSSQQSISNFFFKQDQKYEEPTSKTPEVPHVMGTITNANMTKSKKTLSIASMSNQIYGEQPNCLHGEPCQLKTSLSNMKTRGKKFWCCSRPSVGINSTDPKEVGEHRCTYFEWATKRST